MHTLNLNVCVHKYVEQGNQAIDFLLQLLDTGFIKFLGIVHNNIFLTCIDILKKQAMSSAPLHPIISCSHHTICFSNSGKNSS